MRNLNEDDFNFNIGVTGYMILYRGVEICHVHSYKDNLGARENHSINSRKANDIIRGLISGNQSEKCCLIQNIRKIEGDKLRCAYCGSPLNYLPQGDYGFCGIDCANAYPQARLVVRERR